MVPFVRKMELEEKLKEAGNNLLNPPSSIDEFLMLLDVNDPLFILFLCFSLGHGMFVVTFSLQCWLRIHELKWVCLRWSMLAISEVGVFFIIGLVWTERFRLCHESLWWLIDYLCSLYLHFVKIINAFDVYTFIILVGILDKGVMDLMDCFLFSVI